MRWFPLAQRSVHDWFVENISQGANQHLIIYPWERCVVRYVGWKSSPLRQGLEYAEFRTSTVSRSKHTRSMSGSRRIPYQRFVTVPLSMPRIGGRLRKYRFGGIGADVGIPLRTEDLIRENLNNLITMTIVMAATTVAVRMFRFIHHYGNIMIADGRVDDQQWLAPCNALPKGSCPKAAFWVLKKY